MTKEQLIDKMVADVMEGFDFSKVHNVMASLDWRWDIGCQERTVPSIYRLMKCAEDLLRRTAEHYGEMDYFYTSTGGFWAILENGELTLRFVLEHSSAFEEDYIEEGEEVDNG